MFNNVTLSIGIIIKLNYTNKAKVNDDLEMHLSEWPLVAIALQTHQHYLQQVITHIGAMRSHYNALRVKKNSLQGPTMPKESGDQWTNYTIYV